MRRQKCAPFGLELKGNALWRCFFVYFFTKSGKINVVMVVLTVLMLVALLALVPLPIAVSFRVDLASKHIFVHARVFGVRVFREEIYLCGRYLVCSGSVNTVLDVFTVDGKSGVNLAKALVFDSVNITAALNYTSCSPFIMPVLDGVFYAATAISCAFSNCRVRTSTCFSLTNSIFGEIKLSVSLAEILLALIKESVRQRKKSRKKRVAA